MLLEVHNFFQFCFLLSLLAALFMTAMVTAKVRGGHYHTASVLLYLMVLCATHTRTHTHAHTHAHTQNTCACSCALAHIHTNTYTHAHYTHVYAPMHPHPTHPSHYRTILYIFLPSRLPALFLACSSFTSTSPL